MRVVAATHRDLEALMQAGTFRSDLYYRLNVIQIHVPPLRERIEDVPELIHHFTKKFATAIQKKPQRLAPQSLDLCLTYHWPGNVRELEHAIERAVTLSPMDATEIGPELLPPAIRKAHSTVVGTNLEEGLKHWDWKAIQQHLQKTGSFSNFMATLEWAVAQRAISEFKGNKTQAAQALGRTYRWLRKTETMLCYVLPHRPQWFLFPRLS